MGILNLDGNDDLIQGVVVSLSALQDLPTGAYTLAWGIRHDTLTEFNAIGYLFADGVVEAGLSYSSSTGGWLCDMSVGNPSQFTYTEVADTDYVLVLRKTAGTSAPILSVFPAGGSWSHLTGNQSFGNHNPVDSWGMGFWEGNGDTFDGWAAWFSAWEGTMSEAHTEALVTNWQTSDLWTSAHGEPCAMVELNTITPTDFAGQISDIGVTGATVDAGQTFSAWNFDGTGAGDPPIENAPEKYRVISSGMRW